MLVLEIIKNTRTVGTEVRRVAFLVFMLLLLLFVARAQAQTNTVAYYSTSGVASSSPTRTCIPFAGCTPGVELNLGGIADLSLAAKLYLPIAGVTKLRLQLNGTALAGYRGGMVLANGGALLGLNALGAITLRTFLSTLTDPLPTVAQDTKLVDASAAKAQLLATDGQPGQLELISTKDFNQVEIEFASVLNLGTVINIQYAYGIGMNQSRTVAGYISRAGTGTQTVSGCAANTIQDPENAVDANLSNFATMGTIATINCPAQLKVKLDGTAPGTYKAGFVVGSAGNLLDAGLINSGLVLRTYDAAGTLLESSSQSALLGLNLLPDGRSMVSFQATKPFSYVSIERTGALTLLDNLQLYYGLGVADTKVTPVVLSNFATGTANSEVSTTGPCVACSVTNKDNAEGSNNNAPATINTTVGLLNSVTLKVDLNGPGAGVTGSPGKAGNRAGMVIGGGGLIDADLLKSATLTTYDDKGNVLETASGASLLAVNVLPDGRRTLSFNTTKDFSKVSITVSSVLGVASNTDVFYGFADNSNGQLSIVNPAGPLPVTLTSFAVRRVASSGAALVTWATASEINSASFVVERSANPIDGFVAVGQVAAAGSTTTPRSYSLSDNGAALQTSTLYYRLRQLDADGTAHLSPVAVLAAGLTKASFSIYPNPATAGTQQVTINATADLSAGYSVSVYSTMGQLLSTRVVSSEGATAPLTVSTTGLATGVYHVVLRDAMGQSLSTQRLQVAN